MTGLALGFHNFWSYLQILPACPTLLHQPCIADLYLLNFTGQLQ